MLDRIHTLATETSYFVNYFLTENITNLDMSIIIQSKEGTQYTFLVEIILMAVFVYIVLR